MPFSFPAGENFEQKRAVVSFQAVVEVHAEEKENLLKENLLKKRALKRNKTKVKITWTFLWELVRRGGEGEEV